MDQPRRPRTGIQDAVQLLGVTEPEQALEFATAGIEAPRFDLSDYLVTLRKGDAEMQVGHITYGRQRHLLDQVAHRGVMGAYKFADDRITVSVASMNGSSIVGYDNFAGLNDRHHNITAGTIGVQLMKGERLDSLLETTLLTGQIKAISDLTGEVVYTEKSQGIGFRLLTNAFNRRARSDLSWAPATNEHPFD
jgi:hypothetical protein